MLLCLDPLKKHQSGLVFTCHSEGDQGSDLPLQAVGGNAGVVASVATSDFGEAELAVPLIQVQG